MSHFHLVRSSVPCRIAELLGAIAFGLALGNVTSGALFTVDSTNGTINGLSSGSINGTPFFSKPVSGH